MKYSSDDFAADSEDSESDSSYRKVSEAVRPSRHAQSRAHEGRIKKERPAISISLGSRFNLPQEILDDEDYVYGWVAYSCNGEELQEAIDEAEDNYWEFVPKSEYPTLTRRYRHDLFGRKEEDHLIKKGGQVLMKRLREIDEEYAKAYNERNLRDEEMKKNYVLFDRSTKFYTPGRSF